MSNYSKKTPDTQSENTSWHKIESFVPKGAQVLDVGCSSGKLGQELKKLKGCTVYGTEIDEGDYALAKKVLNGAFLFNVETDDIPTALAKQKFDVIIFADVIEHLVDPVKALKRMKRLLKPAGRIVFSIPNMTHISVRLQLLSGHLFYNETGLLDKTHLHFYDYDEVQRVFNGAGWNIQEVNANILPYPPSFVQKKFAELGLEDTGFIAKLQQDIHAQTFQFVGYSVPVKGPIKKLPLSTKTPERELVEYIDNLNNDVASLSRAVREEAKRNGELERQVVDLSQQNAWLRKGIGKTVGLATYRSIKALAKPIRKLRRH